MWYPAIFVLLFTLMSGAAFKAPDSVGTKADRNATLNFYAGDYPKLLNPMIYTSATEAEILEPMFEDLLVTDPDTGELSCWLCDTFTIAKDKKSVTFELNKKAKFHDGKPLTAQDVKFSFDVMMHPKVDNLNLKSSFLEAIENVEVLGTHKIKVSFKNAKYMNIYAATVPVLPKHKFPYFDKSPEKFNSDNKFNRNPIGSGPYKFHKWNAGKSIELRRNADWWGKDDPRFANLYNFKKVRFKIITNDNVALQAFKKGEFDFMGMQSYNYMDIKKTETADPNKLKVTTLHLEPKMSTSFMFVGWNSRLPQLSDAKTRLALNMLSNRFETLKKFSKGLRPPTNGAWGKDSPYQCPQSECPVIEFNPTKAKELLAEAGWADTDKNGVLDRMMDGKKVELKFTILAGAGDYSKNVLGVYITEMKKAGVNAKLKQLDWTAMTKVIDELKFEAYFSGFRAGYPISPRQLWHSENTKPKGSNSWNFVNKKADDLIKKFEYEFDTKKRIALGQDIHRLIYAEQPVMFHHEGGGCYLGRNKKLKGVELAAYKTTCTFWPRWYKEKK